MKFLILFAGALLLSASARATNSAADCVVHAAAYHRVNEGVLRAILWNESQMKARAFNRNENGTVDVGISQINSKHFDDLRRRGVTPEMLYDPCVGTYVAAWHLSKQLADLGNTWQGIGAYHSRTPFFNQSYANGVAATMVSWGLLPVGFVPFPNAPRSSAEAQRIRKQARNTTAMTYRPATEALQRDPLVALTGP